VTNPRAAKSLSAARPFMENTETAAPIIVPMVDFTVYASLFFVALTAATILPMQSETLLASFLIAGYAPLPLLATASAGNVLGSVINWLLGRGIERFRGRRWFPVSEAAFARAQRWYGCFGKWSLLFSWAPIIGDPLTVVAGVLREPLPMFLLLVGVAKIGRYLVLAILTLQLA